MEIEFMWRSDPLSECTLYHWEKRTNGDFSMGETVAISYISESTITGVAQLVRQQFVNAWCIAHQVL